MKLDNLDDHHLPAAPLPLFDRWYAAARENPGHDPSAMTLSTVGADGRPAGRIVLLKQHGADGFVFYTNFASRKGRELSANPLAALTFWWPWLGRQVRIEGSVVKVEDTEADAYFASRPRASQIGAWASRQSEPLQSREELERAVHEYTEKFAGRDVPRPPHWSGFCLAPGRVEFWHDRQGRLHDRIIYTLHNGHWSIQRLNP